MEQTSKKCKPNQSLLFTLEPNAFVMCQGFIAHEYLSNEWDSISHIRLLNEGFKNPWGQCLKGRKIKTSK